MRQLLFFVSLAALCVCVPALAQDSPLGVTVRWHEYCGEAYAERPRAGTRVFFVGETLRLRIAVRNMDLTRAHHLLGGAGVEVPFVLRATRYHLPLTEPRRGGSTPLTLGLVGEMVRIQGEVPLPEAWTSELQLNGGTAVEWDAVISGPLPPGGYAVTFEYAGTDEDETPIEPAISAFEIRAPAEGERFEIMRRSACAHMLSGRYEQAAAGAARLLKLMPTSSEANLLLAEVAKRLAQQQRSIGDHAQAETFAELARGSYQRTLDLIAGGQDELYLQFANPNTIEEHTASLRVLAKGRQP